MSDTVETPSGDPPPPEASSPPAADPSSSAAGGDDPFAPLPETEAIFPRSYVEKLRTEGHKYRTEAQSANERLKSYDDVYSVYPDEDRQVWMDLARTWAVDPNRAAEVMSQIARSVLQPDDTPDDKPAQPAANGNVDLNGDEFAAQAEAAGLTPQQVEEMIAQALAGRDQAAAEQKAVEDIYGEVRKHGFDPESREGFMVLWTANNETDGDIDAAVARMQEYRQGIIDEYVSGRANGSMPRPSPQGVAASGEQVEIGSFNEARKATEAYLRSQGASSP